MKLAGYGRKEWLGGGLIALAIAAIGMAAVQHGLPIIGGVVVGLAALAWLALAAFFRVPRRTITSDDDVLLSPADGMVRDIGTVSDHGIEIFQGLELVRIGIFLSVLDVHVNRAPCDWSVEYRKYKEGRFLDARDPRCAKENESLMLAGIARAVNRTFPLAVRQVSGAIARRIVCDPQPGNGVKRGEIYGMIKFGSRTELYFPKDDSISIVATVGQKVQAGISVMAKVEKRI